jgi:hypothetical protein
MPFLTQGKTNWKYILIILILAVIVGGGTFWLVKQKQFTLLENKNSLGKNQQILNPKDILREKYRGEERSSPPRGFLVPGSDSIPSQFQLIITYFTDSASYYHYMTPNTPYTNIVIIEDRNENYENYVKKIFEPSEKYIEYKTEKEFDYLGSHGVVVLYYFEGKPTSERYLLLNREGHLFSIRTSGANSYSAENIYNLLKTFKPAL